MWLDLENHDTRVLLFTIRHQQDPFRWFTGDWPLFNGFYRPIPALTFEIDDRLYGNNLEFYCFTNWVIGLFCSYGVVWFVYELFQKQLEAFFAGMLFAGWQNGLTDLIPLEWIGGIAVCFLIVIAAWRKCSWFTILVASSLLLLAAREVSGWLDTVDAIAMGFPYRSIGWPVGRTATLLTLFALPCIAAYCRWERERTPIWAALSIACLILGFLSYEQVVVVPGLLLGSAMALRLGGVKVRWLWHAIPIGLAALYWWAHTAYLPQTRYQVQAYRGTSGAIRDFMSWVFPAAYEIKFLPIFFSREVGLFSIFILRFWAYIIQTISCAVSYLSFKKYWVPIVFGIAGSAGAYAPMAFQHPLVHYHHLPMAMRSVFVVWLCKLAFEKAMLAVSPQSASYAATTSSV
jgi:hypothetical protein